MSPLFSHLSCLLFAIIFSILQTSQDDYRILIKKSEFKLFVYRGAELQRTFAVAVGRTPGDKQRVGDDRTPEGIFSISEIQNSRAWVHDFNDGKGAIRGAYGPWFLRLRWNGNKSGNSLQWTRIGIHGTHDSSSIGTMATEGCIRLRNEELKELVGVVKVGTPVQILP